MKNELLVYIYSGASILRCSSSCSAPNSNLYHFLDNPPSIAKGCQVKKTIIHMSRSTIATLRDLKGKLELFQEGFGLLSSLGMNGRGAEQDVIPPKARWPRTEL